MYAKHPYHDGPDIPPQNLFFNATANEPAVPAEHGELEARNTATTNRMMHFLTVVMSSPSFFGVSF